MTVFSISFVINDPLRLKMRRKHHYLLIQFTLVKYMIHERL